MVHLTPADVARGFTSQAIAAKLRISTRTIESYRVQVMEKMQAESVAVLARQAIRLGRIQRRSRNGRTTTRLKEVGGSNPPSCTSRINQN